MFLIRPTIHAAIRAERFIGACSGTGHKAALWTQNA